MAGGFGILDFKGLFLRSGVLAVVVAWFSEVSVHYSSGEKYVIHTVPASLNISWVLTGGGGGSGGRLGVAEER